MRVEADGGREPSAVATPATWGAGVTTGGSTISPAATSLRGGEAISKQISLNPVTVEHQHDAADPALFTALLQCVGCSPPKHYGVYCANE